MREIYEKYYTVRLYSCPDLHFAPSIIDIPGEYDTKEEARAAAEPEFQKTVSYNERGESYSWFEVQVLEHYKKRKTGKWKPIDLTFGRCFYYCTACEETVQEPICEGTLYFKYCPHCGAKMEVDDEE